jgi:OOP family OmpA-OmpF porin
MKLMEDYQMNRLLVMTTALVLAAVPVANAEQGFSAGVSLGYATVEVEDSGLSFDGSAVGWKLFGRYMFTDNWGIEGGYIDFGTPDEDILGVNVEVDANGFDLFAVGAFPTSSNFELFGKLGFVSWDADAKAEGLTDSDDGTDLALGFGGAYKASDQFSIRGEFEWFDIDDTDAVWMLSIGGEVRFQ